MEIFLAFITGLTTGGLSCLAVQGGLLASSLAQQIEQSPAVRGGNKTGKAGNLSVRQRQGLALPILAFLSAKLLAYSLLGLLFGLAGSMFQLTPVTRAVFQIAVGIFMLGSALRMLNVHPIFRYFVIEPPAGLRRFLRRKSTQTADGAPSLAAPLFLGFLTVLIPCGITQAMLAAAMATGSPGEGAALMFAFTLGTSPVFFGVAYFATRLGARLEKNFTRFVAVVVLLLGLYTIDTGATLAGAPFTFTRMAAGMKIGRDVVAIQPANQETTNSLGADQPAGADQNSGEAAADEGENVVTVNVESGGYFPDVVHAKPGVPIRLKLVSEDVYTCALSFVIPSLGIQKNLESTGVEYIDIPAQKMGTTIPFSCSMGMFVGKIVVDQES